MKKSQWVMFVIVLALIAVSAVALTWFKKNQKLGKPGIKAVAIPGSVQMKIDLPTHVLDFISTNVPEPDVVSGYLPKDTSYAERIYFTPDGFQIQNTVILMGSDRTSIHRPEFCLPGQGFQINSKSTVNIPITSPHNYELPVTKWIISKSIKTTDGKQENISGLYVFWFVADNKQTTGIVPMQISMMRDQLLTGVLQRWAYVSYFTVCLPGQEDVTFERLKKLIAASVPEFQLAPGEKTDVTDAKH
ncbi:MAG TPA: exosortase-associated EpsI family protein [Verrucomicrobiae bacterium]|nr:exosortase-associated EpsI family protein [Verrucomicrobiae bacterium]